MVERFLELAAEALALDGEVVEEAVGVDDFEVRARDQVGFEQRDAVEAPGGVGELVDRTRRWGRRK